MAEAFGNPPVLISEEAIRKRVGELARRISADYAEAGEVLLVGVLRGCFIFLADLARRLTIDRRIDFIAVSSYDYQPSTPGAVRLIMDLRTEIADCHVLIVEDIVDSGQDPAIPRKPPARPSPRLPENLRPAAQTGPPDGIRPGRLSRLRHPGCVGGRLRPRLCRPGPGPTLHRRAFPAAVSFREINASLQPSRPKR